MSKHVALAREFTFGGSKHRECPNNGLGVDRIMSAVCS